MANSDWLPSKDALLLSFATNFSAKITAAPTSYGLVAADATALAALVTAYTTAYNTSVTPSTRTKTTVAAKNVAKAQLVASLRSLAKRIQANPAVTAPQKTDLGLPIHSTGPTPNPAPSTSPMVAVLQRGIRSHIISIRDIANQDKRGKPPGVAGAEIYSIVPASATTAPDQLPSDLEDWRFEGIATKGEFVVDYKGDDVGKTAYIVARWFNNKGEAGPISAPINANVAA